MNAVYGCDSGTQNLFFGL